MAVYGADVRVKVINLSQLTKLSDKLDQVNKKVNYLNASLQKLGKKFKAPNVDLKTDKALKKLQRLNKEWDKLERRKPLKPGTAPGGGGRGGGGRGGGSKFGRDLAKGGLAGAGLGLAGPLGGLAGIAASALNPVQLLGAALGVAAVGAADYAANAAVAAAETQKFQQALRGITFGDDYKVALESINKLSDDFQTDLNETTKQFTKLTAAATANGLSIKETEDIYKGLASANIALGGDNERLQGILLATGQVLSKGKVQAEELRGQIGERLPGAFALFADAVGKTPKELDKALNDGEVTIEDFLKFTSKLFKRFGKNAEEIVNGPAYAGQRLEKALGDLQRNVGVLLQPIGAAFQDVFAEIIRIVNAAAVALQNFLGIGLEGSIAKAERELSAARKRLEERGGPNTQERSELKTQFERRNFDARSEAAGTIKELEAQLKDLRAQQKGQAPNPPTKPVETPDTGTGKGSGSASTPRESKAGQMQRDLKLSLAQNKLAESTLGIYGRELEQLELVNREIEARLTYQKELADIAADDLYADERAIAIQQAKADLDKKLIDLAGDRLAIENEIDKAKKEGLKPLEQEKAVLEALVNKGPEAAEQVRLQQQAADIAKGLGDQYYEDVLNLLKGNAALRKRQELLQEQREMWNQIGQAVGQAIEDTLVNGIAAAVSEAEKLSDVLSDIARQLLSTVGRILINAAINQAAGPGGLFGKQGLPGFKAEGGPINAGMPYIVGEKGPELVIPGAAGTVIPNDAFSAATQALQSNGRGTAAGVDGTASQGEAFAVANGARSISTETSRNTSTMNQIREYEERVINNPEPLKVDYQSTVINNQTYVTEEQFQKGLTQSSNRARQATIRDLRNNPASRKMAGVNR